MSEITFGFTALRLIQEGRVERQSIEEIRTWLATQNLPKFTDEQIVIFLLSCGNDLEATKKTMETYVAVKISCPQTHANWTLEREELQLQLAIGQICLIPQRRSDGCVVVLCRFTDNDYRKIDMALCCAVFCMAVEIVIHDDPPKAIVLLLDMDRIGLMHLTRLKLDIMKSGFKFLQEGLPVALKEIHVLNSVYFIDKIMAIIKPFMMTKLFSMVHFHKSGMDMEKFYEKWLPKSCLPEDYGGDLPSVEVIYQKHLERLEEMQPYFAAMERQLKSIQD